MTLYEELDATSELTYKTDLKDLLLVWAYTHLSALAGPNPRILLTPADKGLLEVYINYLPGNFGLPRDIKQLVDAFVLTNTNFISTQPLLPGTPGGPNE
ncbi:MAG: hypothetical protein P4N59_18400 [Negativicutes bacterium]|nr:hypothetical protein [Negativicutes bacterium]